MGKVIKISDKDLHSMIKESVKCILQERWTSADDNASSFYRLKAQRDKVAKDIFMSWLAQQEPGSREMREIDWPYVSYFDGVFTVKHDREIGDEEVIDGMKFVWIWDQRCDGGWTVKRELPDEEIARYDLDEDFSIETAVEFGRLYRRGEEWKFEAIGNGSKGGLETLCNKYAKQFI
jgi:hypothetical protein